MEFSTIAGLAVILIFVIWIIRQPPPSGPAGQTPSYGGDEWGGAGTLDS